MVSVLAVSRHSKTALVPWNNSSYSISSSGHINSLHCVPSRLALLFHRWLLPLPLLGWFPRKCSTSEHGTTWGLSYWCPRPVFSSVGTSSTWRWLKPVSSGHISFLNYRFSILLSPWHLYSNVSETSNLRVAHLNLYLLTSLQNLCPCFSFLSNW